MNKNNNQEVYEIDLLRLLKAMWRHVILIVVVMLIGGMAGYSTARFAVTPEYEAQVLMYVNNSSIKIGGSKVSISSGELSAAQSLVDTYLVILNSRITLRKVINQAELSYTCDQLSGMITADAVNGTEVFRITVTSTIPEEAKLIANTVAKVLPNTISNVVDGSDVRVVDYAVMPTHRSSPSYTKYTAIGIAIGAILSCGFVAIRELMDDRIHDADYLNQTFSEIPVLSIIPDLTQKEGGNNKYYYGSYGYETNGKNESKQGEKEGK